MDFSALRPFLNRLQQFKQGAQKAGQQIQRTYGQVDKNVFGGLLPGGAATPIGRVYQEQEQRLKAQSPGAQAGRSLGPDTPKMPELTPFERRAASLVHAATGAIANAQPAVEAAVEALPSPMRFGLTSVLNQAPLSANLFARYYTGLGSDNLQIPGQYTNGLSNALQQANKDRSSIVDSLSDKSKNLETLLTRLPSGIVRQSVNDALAQVNSDINRVKQGDLYFNGYATRDTNPLTSTATSLGRVWFEPRQDGSGYIGRDKYDFVYANADATHGPYLNNDGSASQSISIATVKPEGPYQKPLPRLANLSPLTNFGRAIVMQMPDKSFDYEIIPR